MELLAQISTNLQGGDDETVAKLTQQAIEQQVPTKQILDDGLIAGMNVIGDRFKAHEIFLPEVLMAAKAMNAGMDKLKPLLIRDGIPTIGKVVIGSVQGDLHDIGKNLVGIMLKGAGFEVIDLGNDVAPERFVQTAREQDATVIGMSALLTTTMPAMKRVVEVLEEQQLGGRIKTIVGGAPVSNAFARDIGADSYGFDAANAVERVRDLVDEN
ncbi:MAG: corrinoid protein [Planctomycetota bacterium]|jgi:5-methyltetrahydrofolate--homocysteine methyltransferase